jgi:hypothetical protein
MNNSVNDLSFRHSKKVGDFFTLFFERLNNQGVRYCVLHSYDGLPNYAPSDVDMAVASEDLERAESAVFDAAASLGFRVIQKLYYDIPRCYFYVVSFRDTDGKPGFVQLDFMNDELGIGRYLLKTETILKDRRIFKGFWIPSVPVEACYLLIKKVIKKRILPEHERKLQDLLREEHQRVESLLADVLGADNVTIIRELIEGKGAGRKGYLIEQLNRALFVRFAVRKPQRVLLKGVWLMRRILERILSPTGLIIVLVSPDGGGKSTLAEAVLTRLRFAFRNSKRIHWRPFLLPPPRKLFAPRRWNEPEPPDCDPHRRPLEGKARSTMRFIYYCMDYILGFLPKVLWPKIRTYLVVIERYYYDFLIDTKRYRLNISPGLTLLGLYGIPEPDLLFLLSGPPEVIFARKQEIGPDEIRRQLEAIRKLAEKIPNSHVIQVDQPLEDEIFQIEEIILDTLQKRLLKRTARL